MQKKIELLRKTGHIHQVADVTPIEYREGRADKVVCLGQVKKRSIIFYCHGREREWIFPNCPTRG